MESGNVGGSGVLVIHPPASPSLICVGRSSPLRQRDYRDRTTDFWQTLRRNPETGQWDQVQNTELYPAFMVRMITGDLLASGVPEIIVATLDGRVYFHDPLTGNELRTFPTAANPLTSLFAADLDGDTRREILVSTETDLHAYSRAGTLLWSMPGAGGKEIVAGQMDNDPGLEVASSSGVVMDVAARAVQWTDKYGFGAHLRVFDIDNDGKLELLTYENWFVVHAFVTAFDIDRQMPKWSVGIRDDPLDMVVSDLDGDGKAELITCDDSYFTVFDLATMKELRYFDNATSSVSSLATGDVDGDGAVELIWGSPIGYTAPFVDSLLVGDSMTGKVKWQSPITFGPYVGPRAADLDGDAKAEIIICSSDSDGRYWGGRILVFDGATLRLRSVSDPITQLGRGRVYDLEIRDIDGDKRPEILLSGEGYYLGYVKAFGYSRRGIFSLKWSFETHNTYPILQVDAGDLDGDGQAEIAFAEADGTLRVFASKDGAYQESWTYTALAGPAGTLSIEDVDNDGRIELISRVGLANGGLTAGPITVLDGVTHTVKRTLNVQATAMAARKGLMAYATSTGALSLVSATGSQSPLPGTSSPVSGMSFDQEGNLWVGAGDSLYLRRPPSYAAVWNTGQNGQGFGAWAGVIPGAGRVRVVSCSDSRLKGFSYVPSAQVLTISSVTPSQVHPGESLTINGGGFVWVSEVRMGGVSVPFRVESSTALKVEVPATALSGALEVIAATANATWAGTLSVLPANLDFTFNLAQVADGEASGYRSRTSFVLVNPNNYAVSGNIKLWDDNGNPVSVRFGPGSPASEHPFSLAAGGSVRLETSGEGALRVGGAVVSSTAKIGTSAVFRVWDASGRMITDAGVGNSKASMSLMLPVDFSAGFDTGVALFNPGTDACTVTLELLNGSGQSAGVTTLALFSHGHTARFVRELFPLPAAFRGSLKISSPTPVSAIAMRQDRASLTMTTFPVLDLNDLNEGRLLASPVSGFAGATYEYLLPQIANGQSEPLSCRTTLVLFNPGSQLVQGLVQFKGGAGYSDWRHFPNDQESWFSLEPGASKFMQTDGQGALAVGAGLVQSDGPLGMVATYSAYDGPKLVTEAGVFPAGGLYEFAVPVDTTEAFDTGLAVFNCELKTATPLKLQLLDEAGVVVASRLMEPGLVPVGHMAILVSELFPGIRLSGSLVVVAQTRMSALTIRMHANPYFYTTLPRVTE